MNIPKPKKNENISEFMDRCVYDKIMIKNYPHKTQRAAICALQIRGKKNKLLDIP